MELFRQKIDVAGALVLKVFRDETEAFSAHVVRENTGIGVTGNLEAALKNKLKVSINGDTLIPTFGEEEAKKTAINIEEHNKSFLLPIDVKIGSQILGRHFYNLGTGGVQKSIITGELTPYEIRQVADGHDPLPRTLLTTDLHTHFSASVPAKDIIEAGIEHKITYPVHLLDELGVKYNPEDVIHSGKEVKPYSLQINPEDPGNIRRISLDKIDEKELKKLEAAMSAPLDSRITFRQMEEIFDYRMPMTKDVMLFKEFLWKVAEFYQQHGVTYVEHSMTEFANDHRWLKTIQEEMPKITNETGVDMRFLMGIPKTLNDDQIADRIEIFKTIAKNPYIVGVDFLAQENKPTSALVPHMKNLASWNKDNDLNLIIRVHAGENSIFTDNVNDALEIASEYGIRMRIGHGVYGINERTIALLKKINSNPDKPKVIMEVNLSSNLALNHVENLANPIMTFFKEDVPVVLGTDGPDLYHTTAGREAMLASQLGVTPAGFQKIMETEQQHVEWQKAYTANKERDPKAWEIPTDFPTPRFTKEKAEESRKMQQANLAQLISHIESYGIKTGEEAIVDSISDKTPVYIGGGINRSWRKLKEEQKTNVRIAIDMLVHHLDPKKVYLMTEMTNFGVPRTVFETVKGYNDEVPLGRSNSYVVTGVYTETDKLDRIGKETATHAIYGGKNKYEEGPFLAALLKEQNGHAVVIGGGMIPEDNVLYLHNEKVSLSLMKNVGGASSRKAGTYLDDGFTDAKELIEKLHKRQPGLFNKDFDIYKIDEYIDQAAQRVFNRERKNLYSNDNIPDSSATAAKGTAVTKTITEIPAHNIPVHLKTILAILGGEKKVARV